jgi:hypothetical protein
MRKTLSALCALVIAVPVAAQQQAGAAMNHDMTNMVKGSGKLPDGWQLRYDPQRGNAPTPPLTAINFVTMGSGYHFTSGPAAIYYNAKDMGSGEYSVSATFSQRKSVNHEFYGIFIGGHDLQTDKQTYTYFVIDPCSSKCGTAGAENGEILISKRTGDGKPTALVPIRHDAAVVPDDAKDGHATNKLTIHVAKDTVHFIANGKLVAAVPKSQIGDADGQTGLRINHNIDVHVQWEGVKK